MKQESSKERLIKHLDGLIDYMTTFTNVINSYNDIDDVTRNALETAYMNINAYAIEARELLDIPFMSSSDVADVMNDLHRIDNHIGYAKELLSRYL